MGDTLTKPITDKFSGSLEDDRLRVSYSCMQGWRRGMEDAHAAVLKLVEGNDDCSFFGVYDGHCGPNVAIHAGERLPSLLTTMPGFLKKEYPAALKAAYLSIDEEIARHETLRVDGSGCTAVSVLITNGQIFCANAGDSRAVLSSTGTAIPLSTDHKPTLEGELARIERAGSFVNMGRVNGNLALSRALGDLDFKQNRSLPLAEQAISPLPDIVTRTITPQDEFIVLACDGIWDVLDNQQVVNFIKSHKAYAEGDLAQICEDLMDKCMSPTAPGVGCDNMSVIIVQLKEAYVRQFRGSA
jgi:protein phosphatase 2C family protein 2/3